MQGRDPGHREHYLGDTVGVLSQLSSLLLLLGCARLAAVS